MLRGALLLLALLFTGSGNTSAAQSVLKIAAAAPEPPRAERRKTVRVRRYVTKRGKYVQPHYRSRPSPRR